LAVGAGTSELKDYLLNAGYAGDEPDAFDEAMQNAQKIGRRLRHATFASNRRMG
jgi:hypothetical protein